MNDIILTKLKILVERAVRPVRASIAHKRKMREELLAHVSGVFEEELARLGEDQSALERTALRFGNPAEVTVQLQTSVPAGDGTKWLRVGRPGEPAMRGAVSTVWLTGVLALVISTSVLFVAGWFRDWPREAVILCVYAMLALPVYLLGLTLLTDWMKKSHYDHAGQPWFKIALIGVGSSLLLMLWVVTLASHGWAAEWHYLIPFLFAIWLAPTAALIPYALAKSASLRRRYDEEWANLKID